MSRGCGPKQFARAFGLANLTRTSVEKIPGGAMAFRIAAALALAALLSHAAAAQEWPAKPVRAIVPLTAGSATDLVARAVLDQVAGQIGQPIVVDNRPGAGNTIGMAAFARAEPDGYTILINSSSHTIVPATYKNLPFDTVQDFTPVIPLGSMPTVLVVSPSKGYKSVADFVAAAKARSSLMNYSTAGAGNFSHFASEVFRLAAGFNAIHVPSKGAPEAITEVLADRVDFFFSPLIVALPFLRDGKLQALAVSGSQRTPVLPDIPTTVEAGYPNSEYNFWVGMFALAKTAPAAVARLNAETAKAVQTPAVRERLGKLGVDPMPLSQDAFARLVRSEVAINSKIAASAGIQAN
jgi:tripartite-type tricarboxylate transporter receptor subunit TctC